VHREAVERVAQETGRCLVKYVITAGEANERGVWDKLCEMFGLNPWAMNEGLMESSHEFKLDEQQVRQLGLQISD
jgi:hypothetical protein